MRFRRRDPFRELFEDLAEKDRARLNALLRGLVATPGMEGLRPGGPVPKPSPVAMRTGETVEAPKRKRGHRA